MGLRWGILRKAIIICNDSCVTADIELFPQYGNEFLLSALWISAILLYVCRLRNCEVVERKLVFDERIYEGYSKVPEKLWKINLICWMLWVNFTRPFTKQLAAKDIRKSPDWWVVVLSVSYPILGRGLGGTFLESSIKWLSVFGVSRKTSCPAFGMALNMNEHFFEALV